MSREEFDKWLRSDQGKPYDGLSAWNARQPEIDALKAENERLRNDAPTPPAQEDEPRLVSYGLDLETCTLNYQGEEYYFERTSTTAQECKCDTRTRLIGDGCEICNPELAKEMAAQDDPVAWIIQYTNKMGMKLHRLHIQNVLDAYLEEDASAVAIPLYARPQSDKLREAAEKVVRIFHDCDRDEGKMELEGSILDLGDELWRQRTALEGK